jgi:hypothetical protein
MVGLFTFMTIGAAVIYDLWDLLDYKKGLSMVRSEPVRKFCVYSNHLCIAGAILEAFLCPGDRSHIIPVHCLPLLLLGAFQSA